MVKYFFGAKLTRSASIEKILRISHSTAQMDFKIQTFVLARGRDRGQNR